MLTLFLVSPETIKGSNNNVSKSIENRILKTYLINLFKLRFRQEKVYKENNLPQLPTCIPDP